MSIPNLVELLMTDNGCRRHRGLASVRRRSRYESVSVNIGPSCCFVALVPSREEQGSHSTDVCLFCFRCLCAGVPAGAGEQSSRIFRPSVEAETR